MTIDISVIGLGPWGQTLANKLAALPDFALKSTYDHHDARKIAHAEAAPSLESILEDPSVRACVVTTPNHTHADLAKSALKAGKNVLIAKPLAMTSADCDEIAALARARGLVAMTGHTTLFNPGVLLMKRLIAESGRPVLHFDARRRGIGRIQKNSVMLDLAVHDIANAIFVTGRRPVSARHVQRAYGGCPAAQAQMFLAFEGGMTGHVESSWVASERRRLAVATLDGQIVKLDELTARVSVYDTTPTARLAKDNFAAVKTAEYKIDAHDALADELSTFARCIRDGEFPEENAKIARSVVHAIEISEDLGVYS